MNKKAQAFTEYVIAFFIFMTIVVFLYTAFFSRNQPEAEKISEQSSNLIAQALARLSLEDPGLNASGGTDWYSKCPQVSPTRVGLAETTDSPFVISGKKLNATRCFGAAALNSSYAGLAADSNFDYSFSPFQYTASQDDGSQCDLFTPVTDYALICRRPLAGYISFNITNTSRTGKPARFDMDFFVPFTTVASSSISNSILESDDAADFVPVDGGTLIKLRLNVDATDHDGLDISIPATDLVFVRYVSFKYKGEGGDVGNISLFNVPMKLNLGNTVSSPRNKYAEAKRIVLANFTVEAGPVRDELFPTKFGVRAWRKQAVER